MLFNDQSDVTLVITSCGRFDLLHQTIASLDEFNTYPINKVIITEDSGDENIYQVIPTHWQERCEIILNKNKLGQIKSIDEAYTRVETKYIFHCEDDWQFYREGFIEDSIAILENNNKIIQVWLRDYDDDIKVNYPYHFPAEKYTLNNIIYYKVGTTNNDWMGFSFNPGLKRKSDYDKEKPYYRNKLAIKTESYLSKIYHNKGMFAVFLEKSAVKHIGWDEHIFSDDEKKEIRKRKKRKIKHIAIGFIAGFITYFIFDCFLF